MPPLTLPVHLITGLLGSGKTTTLTHLISQKPKTERWGILINEFGDIDIDAASLEPYASQQLIINQVSGGCVCCTAQFALTDALNQLIGEPHLQPLDRVFIEPTGLGHPAKIIDTLKNTVFKQPLDLKAIVCIITPKQLTESRWQKSAVMRDLVTLADIVVLNQLDLSSEIEQACSESILNHLYPKKSQVIHSQFGQVDLNTLLKPHCPAQFVLLAGRQDHQQQTALHADTYHSQIPDTQACQVSKNNHGTIISAGWVWKPNHQFNRTQLKAFFEMVAPSLLRAKGLLKTGNEWQLINWTEQQLHFADLAWRQDNRLELLFNAEAKINPSDIKAIEIQLLNCINPVKK